MAECELGGHEFEEDETQGTHEEATYYFLENFVLYCQPECRSHKGETETHHSHAPLAVGYPGDPASLIRTGFHEAEAFHHGFRSVLVCEEPEAAGAAQCDTPYLQTHFH